MLLFISVLFLTFLAQPAFAADNPLQKFNRGIVNIVTAPLEIAKQVDAQWKKSAEAKENKSVGVFNGFWKGVAYTIGRTGSGIWDVVTCPLKTPGNYEPLMKPDFVLDKDSAQKTEK